MAFRVTTATPSGAHPATRAGPLTRIQPKPEKTILVLSLMVNSCLTKAEIFFSCQLVARDADMFVIKFASTCNLGPVELELIVVNKL